MYRLLVFSLLVTLVAVFNVKTAAAGCNYDDVACGCFKFLKDDDLKDNEQSKVTLLHRVMDMFEDGIEDTCQELKQVVECVENKTVHCAGNETGRCKSLFEGLKDEVPEICEEHKQELIDGTHCVNTTTFRKQIDDCESFIKGASYEKKPTCEALQNTTQCIDDVLDQCPTIHDTLDHLFDEYLEHYFDVEDCHLSASVSLSALTFLLACLLMSFLVTSLV